MNQYENPNARPAHTGDGSYWDRFVISNNSDNTAINLDFESIAGLGSNNRDSNCHIYYSYNDGTDKWSKYEKILNQHDYNELSRTFTTSYNGLVPSPSSTSYNSYRFLNANRGWTQIPYIYHSVGCYIAGMGSSVKVSQRKTQEMSYYYASLNKYQYTFNADIKIVEFNGNKYMNEIINVFVPTILDNITGAFGQVIYPKAYQPNSYYKPTSVWTKVFPEEYSSGTYLIFSFEAASGNMQDIADRYFVQVNYVK